MRHKYATPAIVLARAPQGEANADVYLLTHEFGLVRGRAQGLRKSGAKLAHALQTFAECEVSLVRGKDTWRVSGGSLVESWSGKLAPFARERAGKVAQLLLRLLRGETNDPSTFLIFRAFLAALSTATKEEAEAFECLAALRILRTLGLDAGDIPGEEDHFDAATLAATLRERSALIARVNRGITASGL